MRKRETKAKKGLILQPRSMSLAKVWRVKEAEIGIYHPCLFPWTPTHQHKLKDLHISCWQKQRYLIHCTPLLTASNSHFHVKLQNRQSLCVLIILYLGFWNFSSLHKQGSLFWLVFGLFCFYKWPKKYASNMWGEENLRNW